MRFVAGMWFALGLVVIVDLMPTEKNPIARAGMMVIAMLLIGAAALVWDRH